MDTFENNNGNLRQNTDPVGVPKSTGSYDSDSVRVNSSMADNLNPIGDGWTGFHPWTTPLPDTHTVPEPPYYDSISPAHYKRGIECIDAIKEATRDLKGLDAVCTGNAIKYLWRWQEKGGNKDLEKAIWYIKEMLQPGGDHRK